MDVEGALKKHGLTMPEPPAKGGVYEPVKEFGLNCCYLSGCTPTYNGKEKYKGRVGKDLTLEEGKDAARYCLLNLLANLKAHYGDLGKVKRFVKMLAFVSGTEDFYDHPKVANGASELLVEIFGTEIGQCARSAIGVHALPGNAPVEIELLVEME